MQARVSFYTLGCRLNQAETAVLQRSFEENGYRVVDFKEPSEMVIVNTCTVTENGDADTRKIVNKINRTQPGAQIALVGCQAQVQREKLLEMQNVKWVVGNAKKMQLAGIISETATDAQTHLITPVISKNAFTHPTAGIDRKHTRANLKIQDGCNFFCSFCVIPYARGRARSREFEDIFKEASALVQAGHKELVLTGINVGTYQYENQDIVSVIEHLNRMPGVKRIRISSIEPTTIPGEIIQMAAEGKKLCRYFHIPLQSGSDTILKMMNRRYSTEDFRHFIEYVDGQVPEVCQGTDVIVGFPGESDALFEETRQLLADLPLAYFHVFSYSERPWAKSRKLPDPVPREKIERRSRILRELGARKKQHFFEKHIGKTLPVLFEQQKHGLWSGLTDSYIRVKVKSDLNLKNEILPVKLESIENQFMLGSLL